MSEADDKAEIADLRAQLNELDVDFRAVFKEMVERGVALAQAKAVLEWIDKHWTSSKATRGEGLPACRAALAAVRAALDTPPELK